MFHAVRAFVFLENSSRIVECSYWEWGLGLECLSNPTCFAGAVDRINKEITSGSGIC